ncbi:MAG: hypothetical protein JO256_06245 [Alphaproteobacteria bacterium]|nr:hypothetical protein [Alphaproteobacteria bacterium]
MPNALNVENIAIDGGAFQLHLVCYAAGEPVHFLNRKALVGSAKTHGVDHIHAFGAEDIDLAFREAMAGILDQNRGAGYWLWKPYFILKVLEQAREGDWVVYIDSGARLRSSPRQLYEKVGCAEVILFQNDYANGAWCKRDAFALMDVDDPEAHDQQQLDASIVLVRNSAISRQFVGTWLKYCQDARLLTDIPNSCGKPNLPEFVDHRHDQSILSLLFWRERNILPHMLLPRACKYHLVSHHRRRSDRIPIWLWHLSHDFFESMYRRIRANADLHQTDQ